MNWSRYNTFIQSNSKIFLFNNLHENIILLSKELYSIIQEYIPTNINKIHSIHEQLFHELQKKHFIIDDSVDEFALAKKKKKNLLQKNDTYIITINPTLSCNANCWYCYEKKDPNKTMPSSILMSIKTFISKIVTRSDIKNIQLSFFGGEPLLSAHNICLPLISYTNILCKQYNKNLSIYFTTNALLLSEEICDLLEKNNCPIYFQIPFDGGEREHNKTKKSPLIQNPYITTLNNVLYAAKKGFSINIRCNYTMQNIDSFKDLINQIYSNPITNNNINFSVQKIWQETDSQELQEKVTQIKELIKSKRTDYSDMWQKQNNYCYADYQNSIVINYNGDLYKCTSRDFTSQNKIGILSSDGDFIKNKSFNNYTKYQFLIDCETCKLLPICNVCSQNKIESPNGKCPIQNKTPQYEQNYIESKFKEKYHNLINSYL